MNIYYFETYSCYTKLISRIYEDFFFFSLFSHWLKKDKKKAQVEKFIIFIGIAKEKFTMWRNTPMFYQNKISEFYL